LSIDAAIDLMAGPDFAASVVLSAAGATLTGDVSGSGSDLRAELTGDDLHFTYDGSTLLVAADNASLAPFLGATDTAAGLSGTVDGTLGYQQSTGWTGALVTDLAWQAGEAPADPAQPAAAVTAAVTLRGTGDALELLVTATGPADSHLSASGSLAPSLDITAIATALNGAVAAEVDYQPAVGLTGTLTTASFAVEGYAQVPAQHAVLTWLPGQPVQVTGPGIDFTVDVAAPDAPLSGTLDLPFTLLDAPARLDAVLGGSLEAPSASLEVVGAGLAAIGTGTLSAAEATLTITEPAITRLLPDVAAQFVGLGVSPVTADAHWTADSGWTLVANSQ